MTSGDACLTDRGDTVAAVLRYVLSHSAIYHRGTINKEFRMIITLTNNGGSLLSISPCLEF